jgi:competence protein ComEC
VLVRNKFDAFLERQRGRFVLLLPAFLAAGMLAYFSLLREPSLTWAAGACAGCAIATGLVWRHILARAVFLGGSFAVGGFALACLATGLAPAWPQLPRHAVVVAGRIAALEVLPAGRRVTLAQPSLDGGAPLARTLRIRLRTTDAQPLNAGDTIQVRALLRPPSAPDIPGGWDTQRDAWFAGLAGYGFAIGPAQLIAPAATGAWTALRERIAGRIMAALPGAPGAISATLLTGLGTAIPPADRAAFQDSGLAHLLAVAGLHIGIVMGLVFYATRLGLAAWEWAALTWPTRQMAAVTALAAGGLYLALTGAHVPILRSFAMASLVTLGVLTGRRAISLRGLALAAFLLLALSPASVVGVSFQMSFSSVLALIAGYELARPVLARIGAQAWWRRLALHTAGLGLTSALAGTASLPFAAYHFGRATLYYVPANMLAVPITALWVMPWGLAALALMPFGLEGLALAPMGWGVRALLAIAHRVAAWPASVTDMPQAPAWSLGLVAMGLVWGGLWRGRLRLAGVLPLAVGLAAPWFMTPPDVLVTPQAELIALHLGTRVFVHTRRAATGFQAEAPTRLWGTRVARPFDSEPGFGCTQAGCRATFGGRTVQFVSEANGVDCSAALIVSPLWLHAPCDGTAVIDASLVAEGAAVAWVGATGTRIRTDFAMRGARPWVIRARPKLPMAAVE